MSHKERKRDDDEETNNNTVPCHSTYGLAPTNSIFLGFYLGPPFSFSLLSFLPLILYGRPFSFCSPPYLSHVTLDRDRAFLATCSSFSATIAINAFPEKTGMDPLPQTHNNIEKKLSRTDTQRFEDEVHKHYKFHSRFQLSVRSWGHLVGEEC